MKDTSHSRVGAATRVRRSVIGLIVATSLAAIPVARPASAQTVPDNRTLTAADGYIAGLGFSIAAILKFKQHKDNPTQIPIGTPPSLVFVSPALRFLPNMLSCPVFVGPGTMLGEESCVWGKVTGEAGTQGAAALQGVDWRVGGQFEVATGWFLGGGLGTGVSSSQMPIGLTASGRTFDAAVAIKRIDGPLYLAGVVGLSTTTDQTNWAVTMPGGGTGVMTSGANTLNGGLLLRGAYQIALDPVYLRPRLDVGVGYISHSGLQESGPATAVTVDPYSKAGVQITPMLEFGGRADIGSVILRPYVAAGASFFPDNTLHLSGSVGGTPYSGDIYGTSAFANVEAGLQVYEVKSWEMKLEYRLTAADSYLDQSLGLRAAKHF